MWFNALVSLITTCITDREMIYLLGKKRFLKVFFAQQVCLYNKEEPLYSAETTDIIKDAIELIVCGYDGLVDEMNRESAERFCAETLRYIDGARTLYYTPSKKEHIFFQRLVKFLNSHNLDLQMKLTIKRMINELTLEHLNKSDDTLMEPKERYETAGLHVIFQLLLLLEHISIPDEQRDIVLNVIDLGSVVLRILDDALDLVYLKFGLLSFKSMEDRNLIKKEITATAMQIREAKSVMLYQVNDLIKTMDINLSLIEDSCEIGKSLLTSMKQSLYLYPKYVIPLVEKFV